MNNKDTEALDREDSIYEKAFAFYQQWRDPVDPSDEHTAFTSGYEHGYLAGRASMREEQRWIEDENTKLESIIEFSPPHQSRTFKGHGLQSVIEMAKRTNHEGDQWKVTFERIPVAPPTQETEEGGS